VIALWVIFQRQVLQGNACTGLQHQADGGVDGH
jgi:hypothetical protein